MNDMDTWVGTGMIAAGSTGLTIQVVMSYVSFGVIGANLLLALGGGYLLWLRIKKAKESLKQARRSYDRAVKDKKVK